MAITNLAAPVYSWSRRSGQVSIFLHVPTVVKGSREIPTCKQHLHLDILPDAKYLHLECLLKDNKNVSNCYRGPWTC